jgi:hypothetical protein
LLAVKGAWPTKNGAILIFIYILLGNVVPFLWFLIFVLFQVVPMVVCAVLPVKPRARQAAPFARSTRTAIGILGLLLTFACGGGGGDGAAAPPPPPPVITSYSPGSGPAGTLVTIQGTGLTGTSGVSFGEQPALTFQSLGDVQATARVPAGAATGPLTLAAPGGQTSAAPFSVVPTPPNAQLAVVSGFTPPAAAPGTQVIITGTGFNGVTQVDFGGIPAVLISEQAGTLIRATVPAGAGTGPITVVTLAGAVPSAAAFVAQPAPPPSPLPPVVTAFTPPAGPANTKVTLAGRGFTGATQVNFGGQAALAFQVTQDTSLTAWVPLGAVTGPISVIARAGSGASTSAFTLQPAAPAQGITGFSPTAGPAGTAVTITGTGFLGATQVEFAGVAAAFDSAGATDTQITATVPAGAGTGPITIVVPGGVYGSAAPFTGPGSAPPAALPAVAGFSPASGPVGATVTLTGTGFAGATQVDFGGTAATRFLASPDGTSLTAVVPPGAANGVITVVTPAGSGASSAIFTVAAPPSAPGVPTFTPTFGRPNTPVTLTGTGFLGATQVEFNGVAGLNLNVVSDTSLTVTVPATAATGPVTVVTPGGGTASATAFTVLPPLGPLSATAFSPATGIPYTPVVLTGGNMDQAAGITFGGLAATSFQVAPDTLQITVPVPPGAATGPVVIQTGGGPVTVPGGPFTVLPAAPGISGYSPVQGIPGTEVTLTGLHFTGATQVSYGGTALGAARYNVDSDTSVRVRVPDDAAANGAIGVVTPAGTAFTSAAFTVLPSRSASFTQPFVDVSSTATGNDMLDFPVERRTDQYQFLQYPQAPIFHAYDPISAPPGNRAAVSFATFTLNFMLPAPFYEVIPDSVKAQIAELGIQSANVDIFCVSQDYAYDGVTPYTPNVTDGIYLFRPHYWADPAAPNAALNLNDNFHVGVGLFEQEAGIVFAGHLPTDFFYDSISVHSETPGALSQVISSGQQFPMAGFNINNSTSFWSVTQLLNRAAATLHLFFNDADQATLQGIAGNPAVTDVATLATALAASPLGATRGVAMLSALARPVINSGIRIPAGSGDDQLTLTGSCMTGTTAVTLGGVPVVSFTMVSDAILQVTVPSGATGNLVVTTGLGASAPTPAP